LFFVAFKEAANAPKVKSVKQFAKDEECGYKDGTYQSQ
jgi:hypothetical protein